MQCKVKDCIYFRGTVNIVTFSKEYSFIFAWCVVFLKAGSHRYVTK
jgi:hypothetical protein